MSSMMMMMVVAIGGLLVFKGCDFGIEQLCGLFGDKEAEGAEEELPEEPLPPAAGETEPDLEGDLGMDEEEPIGGGPIYQRLRMTTVMEKVADMAVEDIDSGTFFELGRTRKLNLKATLLFHYKSWLEAIAEYNDLTLKPLEGRALAKYSQLILDISRRLQIRLNPSYDAQLRAQTFSGTPLLGNTTANRVRIA